MRYWKRFLINIIFMAAFYHYTFKYLSYHDGKSGLIPDFDGKCRLMRTKSAPWAENAESILNFLNTSLDFGLSSTKIEDLQIRFGKNILSFSKNVSVLKIIIRQLHNPMVYALSVAAVVAFFIGETLNGVAILSILIINASIGFFQEFQAEKAIQVLEKRTVPKARVVRDGKIHIVEAEDILPGDILYLEAGDYVVADARVVEAYQLSTDESILTGESLPVEKSIQIIAEDAALADRKNMLYAGTAVRTGTSKAVVTSIGKETEIGKIAKLLSETSYIRTPIQERLENVNQKLLIIGGVVILIVAILGVIEGRDWFTILMAAISLAVAAIPEGMPTVVTIALTLAVRRMTKRHALVRKISAVEALGSTDIICTDKTGTLTTGKMRVREVFTLSDQVNADLFSALVLCNNASFHKEGSGDPTEVALLIYANDHGIDVTHMRQEFPRKHEWSFDSDRKRMTVAVESSDGLKLYCKGAPEGMLLLCQLDQAEKNRIEKEILLLSSSGRRVLAIATKNEKLIDISERDISEVESNFRFLALVAMADPPKTETISSISLCKAAGIKVVMITGDHPATANAIAQELGISGPSFNEVMTGQELEKLTTQELKSRVERTAVYARVTPEHKLRIVEALQSNGHIVSMTGDGVNDAPALKKASIGVAMGKAGTEVARQSSSIILTDDNFSTITAAVEEGRAIYGNIKRTIQYLFSTNLAEIMIVLGSSLLALPIPLTPISLLWINLVTDGFPSLALAAEPVEKNFLSTSKNPSPSSFFDRKFMSELYLVAFLMTAIVMAVYMYALSSLDVLTARSYCFTLLVYLSLFRSFSCRSEKKTFFELPLNLWHISSVIIPVTLQFALQHIKVFQDLFGVRVLSVAESSILFLLSILPVTVVELMKIFKRRNV